MRIGEGTVIFVTGGASGLGKRAVIELHAKGASVAIADVDVAALQALHAQLQERVLCIPCDVTQEAQVKRAVEQTVETFGRLDVALASAGIIRRAPTLSSQNRSFDTDVFRKILSINLLGSVYTAKYAAVAMSKNRGSEERGLILFVSSIAAEEAERGQVSYGASKGAINGLVLPMARDLGRYGIRVAAIAPGIFLTPMAAGFPQKLVDQYKSSTPMGRPGTVEEFAHMVVFCIENGYINGVRLRIDGATKLAHR